MPSLTSESSSILVCRLWKILGSTIVEVMFAVKLDLVRILQESGKLSQAESLLFFCGSARLAVGSTCISRSLPARPHMSR